MASKEASENRMARAVARARSGETGQDWHAQRREQDSRGNRWKLRQVSRSSQQNQRGLLLPLGPLNVLWAGYATFLAAAALSRS
jgi:hypothetical protein